jgi:hypothetical protein
MRDGDSFAKKFGGPDGTDPDYFRLIISGYDQYGDYTGTIVFYLADFRSPNADDDYILDQWTWVDLASLGSVVNLEFTMESSDAGLFGINTPTYFAIDNLTTASGSMDVVLDIMPGSEFNPVNPDRRGYMLVTISGTESLDVKDVDINSLTLQGVSPWRSYKYDISAPAEPTSPSPTNFGSDEYADLLLLFDTQQIIATLGQISEGQVLQLDLTGTLIDGTPIQGSDEILIKSRRVLRR